MNREKFFNQFVPLKKQNIAVLLSECGPAKFYIEQNNKLF